MKICSSCNIEKYESEFPKREDNRIRRQCRNCLREKHNERRRKNPEAQRILSRKYRKNLTNGILKIYSSKCNCCGETEVLFLTLDHVKNNGNIERQTMDEYTIMRKIINGELPKEDYQILCMNCNFGKFRNGGTCPHTTTE